MIKIKRCILERELHFG